MTIGVHQVVVSNDLRRWVLPGVPRSRFGDAPKGRVLVARTPLSGSERIVSLAGPLIAADVRRCALLKLRLAEANREIQEPV